MKLTQYVFLTSMIIFGGLVLFPQYDLSISQYFYEVDKGFIHAHSLLATAIFKSIPIVSILTATILIIGIIRKYFSLKAKTRIIKSPLLFLLLSLALGPGLIVNGVLKENWGRARPSQITDFGGNKQFSPAIYYSKQCHANCSFSSGHASMGFYFTSLSWVLPSAYQNLGMISGIVFGLIIGIGRIAQGGHFFSDVIFSLLVVLSVNWVCFKGWKYLCSLLKDDDNDIPFQQRS